MKTEIIRAASEDIDAICGMMQDFYVHESIVYDNLTARAAIKQLMENPSYGSVFIINTDGSRVGYMVVTYVYSLEFHGLYALIDELYIKENSRGKGIGTECLSFVENMCRQMSIASVRLEVEYENISARKLYENSGFKAHDRHIMTKWLKNL